MLPHEPHWYTAMESNEQLIYEMLRWFDKYVKNAPPRHCRAVPSKGAWRSLSGDATVWGIASGSWLCY